MSNMLSLRKIWGRFEQNCVLIFYVLLSFHHDYHFSSQFSTYLAPVFPLIVSQSFSSFCLFPFFSSKSCHFAYDFFLRRLSLYSETICSLIFAPSFTSSFGPKTFSLFFSPVVLSCVFLLLSSLPHIDSSCHEVSDLCINSCSFCCILHWSQGRPSPTSSPLFRPVAGLVSSCYILAQVVQPKLPSASLSCCSCILLVVKLLLRAFFSLIYYWCVVRES